jgi:ABC-type phosphate transport system substrate-binding protein
VEKKKLLAVLGTGLVIVAITATASPAQADPNGAPTFRQLVGVGSDTTQGVMNGLSDVITVGGTKVIGSYDAVGSTQITTKDPAVTPNCTINRPTNSGTGVDALVASLAANDGCVQFARSSSNNSSSYAGKNLTYIPFAKDAVTYAIRTDSAISKKLTTAQLTTVYNCAAGANFLPLLPKFGSGTRKFFLQSLGFTDAANFTSTTGHTCIKEVDATNTPIEENTGTVLSDPKQVIPYSIAQYLSQINGVVADVHGKSMLGALDGLSASVLNTTSTMTRDVYNVVPTGNLGTAPYSTTFVTSGSAVCTNTSTIVKYGFGVNANCGSTSLQTP